MRKSILLPLLLVIFSMSCSEEVLCPTLSLEQGTITNQDECAIVETIIETEFKGSELHLSQGPLLNGHSATFSTLSENSEFGETEIEEYKNLNSESFIWGEEFSSSTKLINENEIRCHFEIENDGWNGYYDKYEDSDGILAFARPYINENGDAFIEYEMLCGYLCGYGYIAVLKKEGSIWVVRQVISTWIS